MPEAEGRKEVSRRLLAALQRQLRSQVVQPLMKRAASLRTGPMRQRSTLPPTQGEHGGCVAFAVQLLLLCCSSNAAGLHGT